MHLKILRVRVEFSLSIAYITTELIHCPLLAKHVLDTLGTVLSFHFLRALQKAIVITACVC